MFKHCIIIRERERPKKEEEEEDINIYLKHGGA